MTDFVYGYGPSLEFGPSVPDYLLVGPSRERARLAARTGPVAGPSGLSLVPCEPPIPLQDGWPLIFRPLDIGSPGPSSVAEWFPLADEARWRADRAEKLVASVTSGKVDPEVAIRTIKAAGHLVRIDVEKVAADLGSKARPGESLADAFTRTR